jgi:hypothetical protein
LGISRTGAEDDLRLYALTQCSDNLKYSGKESSCKSLYANFKMLKSILLLMLSQFKVARSSCLANLLNTKNPRMHFGGVEVVFVGILAIGGIQD